VAEVAERAEAAVQEAQHKAQQAQALEGAVVWGWCRHVRHRVPHCP
jgi:hypothetical protein